MIEIQTEIKSKDEGDDIKINGKDGDDGEAEKCYSIDYFMLPTKIAYFLNAARAHINPFLILFLVSIGFNIKDAGLIAGLGLIGGIIGAPALGLVADKCRIHKELSIVFCVLTTLTICIQPVLGMFWGDKHRFRCPFEMNQTSHNNYDGLRNSANHDRLFYSFLLVGFISKLFEAGLKSFIDMGCLRRVQSSPRKTYFGRQRWVRALGWGSGTMAYSIAISYYPTSSITSCETGVFVIYFGISVFLGIACYYLFKGFKKESEEDTDKDITGILKLTFCKLDNLFFFTTVLFSGMIKSMYCNFLYLRLKEINAVPLQFGFQAYVYAASGMVVSYF